jgi:hypothetical protein
MVYDVDSIEYGDRNIDEVDIFLMMMCTDINKVYHEFLSE